MDPLPLRILAVAVVAVRVHLLLVALAGLVTVPCFGREFDEWK
jgi:hypothetical protein